MQSESRRTENRTTNGVDASSNANVRLNRKALCTYRSAKYIYIYIHNDRAEAKSRYYIEGVFVCALSV